MLWSNRYLKQIKCLPEQGYKGCDQVQLFCLFLIVCQNRLCVSGQFYQGFSPVLPVYVVRLFGLTNNNSSSWVISSSHSYLLNKINVLQGSCIWVVSGRDVRTFQENIQLLFCHLNMVYYSNHICHIWMDTIN